MDENNNNASSNQAFTMPQASSATPSITRSSIIFGVFGIIIGVIIGGLGIFGIMQLINPDKCKDCDCPQSSNCSNAVNSVTTGFFALEPKGENIIYSPLSINYALSMLNTGASGTTKTEIEKVLGDVELPKYQNIADTLSVANGIFIKDSFSSDVLPSYINTVSEEYQAEVKYDSFENTDTLNSWIKNKTFSLIDKVDIKTTPSTKMFLANALAIQMDWVHRFDEGDTSGKTFFKNDGTEMIATTMNLVTHAEDVLYYTDDNITMISMPLVPTDDSALEFVAVMPSGNLNDYIDNINITDIESKLAESSPASSNDGGLIINIPKFKFDYQLGFVDDLKAMGINQAFNEEKADFSNMASLSLYVSDAVHKATIDFSEEGIKAAAVTVFGMDTMGMKPAQDEPLVINIDHPFLFLIRDKNNDTIWFIGAVYEPNLWADDVSSYKPEY